MGKRSKVLRWTLTVGVGLCWVGVARTVDAAQAATVSEDIPEEVLQVQVNEGAYSRVDGAARSASDYTLEQKQLQIMPENVPARIAPEVKQLIDLLRIRKAILDLIPFR